MKMKLAARRKKKKEKKARASTANKATAPIAAVPIKASTFRPKVVVTTTNKPTGASASNKAASTARKTVAKAAPPADDDVSYVSVSTELTDSTGMTDKSARGIDTTKSWPLSAPGTSSRRRVATKKPWGSKLSSR